MITWFVGLSAMMQALIGTLFTYACTAAGAAMVFFFKEVRQGGLSLMLGFASGVMIAASFWSLLAPAIEMAQGGPLPPWLVVSMGFLAGGGFLLLADQILPHAHFDAPLGETEGIKTGLRRNVLLVLAITLHNIPEGLAIGVAFAAAAGDPLAAIAGVTLAMGMGMQNFPEGAAVSIPLRQEGMSRGKSFFYGQASGIVEPIAGVIGAYLVTSMSFILPYALAFAAGAMIYVVVEELLPESQHGGGRWGVHLSTYGAMIGFVIMMMLDVGLGA